MVSEPWLERELTNLQASGIFDDTRPLYDFPDGGRDPSVLNANNSSRFLWSAQSSLSCYPGNLSLNLEIWKAGLPQTNNDHCSLASNSNMDHPRGGKRLHFDQPLTGYPTRRRRLRPPISSQPPIAPTTSGPPQLLRALSLIPVPLALGL